MHFRIPAPAGIVAIALHCASMLKTFTGGTGAPAMS